MPGWMEPAWGLPAATSRERLGGLDHAGLLQRDPDGASGVAGAHHHGGLPGAGAGPVVARGEPGDHRLEDLDRDDAGPADEREGDQQHDEAGGRDVAGDDGDGARAPPATGASAGAFRVAGLHRGTRSGARRRPRRRRR